MAATDSVSRLPTIQRNVDDIRQLTLCKVCLRPFYEPFILICGHTFCYGCLRNWFCGDANRRKKKNCPECRTNIKATPAPNYTLRDLAHLFLDRPELLPEDETQEEHIKGRSEEALLLAGDRRGRGLFQGIFERYNHSMGPGAMVDLEDGVDRCPLCHWELEDVGECFRCGWEDDEFTDEDSEFGNDNSLVLGSHLNPYHSEHDGDEDGEAGVGPYYDTRSDIDNTADGTDGYSTADSFPVVDYRWQDEDGDDDDDMHDFISDDEDHPDEVDYDNYELQATNSRPQRPLHTMLYTHPDHFYPSSSSIGEGSTSVPDNNLGSTRTESSDEDDDEDEDEDNIIRPQRHGGQYMPERPPSIVEDDDDQTVYDESSEASSPPRVVAARTLNPGRRAHIIISDDEDEEVSENEPGSIAGRPVHNRPTTVLESDGEDPDNDDSDDSTPPQSAVSRRHRLQVHRDAQARRSNSTSNDQRGISRLRGSANRLPGSNRSTLPVSNTTNPNFRSTARGNGRNNGTTRLGPRPAARVH